MKNFDTTIPFEESSTSYGFGRIRVPIIFVRTRPLMALTERFIKNG